MKADEKRNGRRKTIMMIIGTGLLAIIAVVASSLKIFTGGPGASSETTTKESPRTTAPATTGPAAVTSTITTAGSTVASATGTLAWPRLKATNVKSLEVLKPLKFNYPLEQTANILVKLGVKAENGVGPDGDIVAFSNLCQHQGCPVGFLPAVSQGYCSCHGSTYDFTHNGGIITGPTTEPVPRVLLEYDGATGDIYVVGMGPPVIYGQGPLGDADPSDLLKYDLQGGQIVTEITLVPLP